jgi:hypothetical protein
MRTDDGPERRNSPRTLRREEVSIQVLLPSADGSSPALVVATETVDLSPGGLRLRLPRPLQAHHIFDLCVELKEDPRRFLLTGETRWCRPCPDCPDHEVGITILDGEGTDFAEWTMLFDPPAPAD